MRLYVWREDYAVLAAEAARRSSPGASVSTAELVRDAVARLAEEIRLREENGAK